MIVKQFIFRDKKPKGKRTNPFTSIANSLINDKDLSPEHVGIMITLLTNKDDFNQIISAFARRIEYSDRKLQKKLRYLESLGYVERKKFKQDNGRWSWMLFVYEIPRPPGEKPTDGHPMDGEPNPLLPSDGSSVNIITTNLNKEEEIKISLKKEEENLDNKKQLIINTNSTPNLKGMGTNQGLIKTPMEELPPEAYEEEENERVDCQYEYLGSGEWKRKS